MKLNYVMLSGLMVAGISILSTNFVFADESLLDYYMNQYSELLIENEDLKNQLREAILDHQNTINRVKEDYRVHIQNLDWIQTELDKPKTTIQGTEIHWEFQDSKGNQYRWYMPVIEYENLLRKSDDLSSYVTSWENYRHLELNGNYLAVPSFDGFVQRDFVGLIDEIYENSESNQDFIYEVWLIVSQLTVYELDVNIFSEGRFALETFSRGGGDCEDLVILIADMILSSSYTEDWIVSYVYMDAQNPSDPQTMNHVILHVDDGEQDYYIEATNYPSWDYYPDGVNGWWYEWE